MEPIHVVIVGAGPTGLTLALHLSHYGIKSLVIEQKEPFDQRSVEVKNMSKALAVHSRTLEHLQLVGLSDTFLKQGLIIKTVSWNDNHFHFDHLVGQTEFPFTLSLSQTETEIILYERCKEKGVSFKWFTKITGVHQDDNNVYIDCLTSEPGQDNTTTTIRGLYLAGCDGAHSKTRTFCNIPFEGKNLERLFLMFDGKIDGYKVQGLTLHIKYMDISPGVRLQIFQGMIPHKPDDYRYMIEYPYHERHRLPEKLTPDFFNKIFQQLNPEHKAEFLEPRWITYFTIQERLAEHYRVGRVFLAGDACHTHSPLGGMGMNTGIQDSAQLAWRLAYVLLGKVVQRENFLDGYNLERRPIGEAVIKNTSKGMEMIQSPILELTLQTLSAIQPIIPESLNISLMKGLSMLNITYANKPTAEETPSPTFSDFIQSPRKSMYSLFGWNLAAGDRAPHGTLSPLGGQEKVSMYSLLARNLTKFHLFLLIETNFKLAAEVVCDWRTSVSESLAHVVVLLNSSQLGKEEELRQLFQDVDVFFDVDGVLWQNYCGWELVFIRPDSFLWSLDLCQILKS